MIFTDSDQLEMIETLITGIPDLEFYIAALTLMSDKLLQLQDYENVYLYPVVSEEKIKELFDLCDIYLDINLDINHYNEVYDSTNLAVNNSMAVFAFENTVHRREICLKKNMAVQNETVPFRFRICLIFRFGFQKGLFPVTAFVPLLRK